MVCVSLALFFLNHNKSFCHRKLSAIKIDTTQMTNTLFQNLVGGDGYASATDKIRKINENEQHI